MKIERVRIEAFGRLAGVDSGEEPLGDMVVVLGPNEAGKSTLFHFLTTALYGFHPASRERNPYTPWGGENASGEVSLRLDTGRCIRIARKLKSQPSGILTAEGGGDDIRNRALPWVDHVPHQVFRQVFAVTLGDLAGLDEETWAKIQDRILGAMGATDLQPARSVADALEKEAGELWRPHRRGNQKIRGLQEEVRALRARRREAVDRDRDIRRLVRELGEAEARLVAARQEREEHRVRVERMERLVPVRAQLARIQSLRDEGGPRDDLKRLPPDPSTRWTELRERAAGLRRAAEESATSATEPLAAVAAFDDAARAVLGARSEIEGLLGRTSIQSEQIRLDSLTDQIEERARRLDALATDVLSVPWARAPHAALAAVPVRSVREHVRAGQDAREEKRALSASPAHVAGDTGMDGRLPIALVVLGVVLLGVAFFSARSLFAYIGSGFFAAGLALWFAHRRSNRPPESESPEAESLAQAAAGREDAARQSVAELLREIPVLPARLANPDEALASELERLRDGARDAMVASEEAARLKESVQRTDREVIRMATSLGIGEEQGAGALLGLLDRQLRRAERLRDAAASAEREVARQRRAYERILDDLNHAERKESDLRRVLASLSPDGPEAGLGEAERRTSAHARADQLQAELERQYFDLADLVARIHDIESSEESWTMDDDDLARRRTEITALGDEIESLARVAEALSRDIAHIRERETVDAIDGEIEQIESEQNRLVRERDRRWVIAQLIREADRRFREEHQPDLIKRAGRYLAHLTNGRYDRMLVDETAKGDLFQVMGPGLAAPIPLTPPVSTGTLEQAYLSLRLAIVDHLDREGERLPLFIDEAFVNWDRDRRGRGVEVLESIARSRQLFFFTCHPEVARELEERGGRLLRLERDR